MVTETATFTIRPVRPEEYAALGDLIAGAYLALGDGPGHADWYIDELRDIERRATTSCVLAAIDAGGRLLGGVTYVAGPEDPYQEELEPGDAGIRMLAVDPAVQRRGVGAALVGACVARAREAGRRRVVLHTGTWMTHAQRLYDRLGFRRRPAGDWEPLPDVHLLCYVLDL